MNKKVTNHHYHLLFADRVAIEQGLYDGKTFKQIASLIYKHPSTVSREVKRSIAPVPQSHDCIRKKRGCYKRGLCSKFCRDICSRCVKFNCVDICHSFEEAFCERLLIPPYVCNPCDLRFKCAADKKRTYRAKVAQKIYEDTLSKSRQGINCTLEELRQIDNIVVPLIEQGQPISHIFATHATDLGISRKTLYNYIDMGAITVKNIDLRRRVRYKKRRRRKTSSSIDIYTYRKDRTYRDFQAYIKENPNVDIVEMDTVKGSKHSGVCLLTMLFRSSSLMLIFKLNRCRQADVLSVFDSLTKSLGLSIFRQTFPVILTDNGSEFKNVLRLENTIEGEPRTKIFFCDPMHSNQKGKLEKNHEYIRYIIPKGRSMQELTNDDVRLIMNHINNTIRDSLNGHSPYEVAQLLQNKEVLRKLGLTHVSPDKVNLTPALLK